ncbi:uncharacterized protein [Prorops nasuta]|uniref:uncharacterized protein n=1 Tax=Prorops nasuta TaxID=863751 RepID=UPI0034CF82B0
MERTPSRSTMGRPSTPSKKSTWSRSGSRSRSMKSSVAEPVDDVTSRQSGTSSRLPTNETVYSRGKSDADEIERFSSLVTPKDSIATLTIVFSSASESKPMDDMSMSNESDIENLDSDEQLAREERRATSMRSKRDSGRSKSVRSKSRSSAKRTSSATSKTNYEISEDNDTIDAASRPEVSFLSSRSSKPYTQSISTPRTSLSTRQGSSSKRGSSFYTPTDDTIISRALSTAESDAIPTIVAPNDSVTTVTIVISSPTVSRSTRSDFGYLPSEERLISGQRRSTSARTKRDSARSESARTTTKSSVGKVMSDVSFNRGSNYESLGDDDITESKKKAGISFISPRTSSRYSELTTTTKPSSSSRQSSRSKPASSLYAATNDSVFSRGQSNAEESEYLSEADDESYQPISHSRGTQQSMRKSTMQESLLAAEEERRSTVDRSGRSTVQTLEAMERTPSRCTMGQERASTPSRRSTRSRSTSRSIKSSMAEPVDDASNR